MGKPLSRKMLLVAALALLAAAAAVWGVQRLDRPAADAPAAGPRSGGAPVAVAVAPAQREDVPIWLDGLGTVQAFNTVTVRVRVDGELQQVAFAEGQEVKAGDLLARIDPRPFQAQLDQAQAKQAQDEAQLGNAQRDLQRAVALRDYASRQSVDTQRALVAQLTAALRADEAAIESAQVQLGYTRITAPIDGRAGLRLVDQGNIVHAGDPGGIVTITQIQPISVVFTLPEQTMPAILDGAAAGQLTTVALDRDGRTELGRGTLSVIDNQIEQSTGTIRLKATFPNEPRRLWPGQFVNIRLLVETRRDAITVPAAGVQRGPRGAFAFVVKPDHTVEARPLTVGRMQDGKALIEAGLQPGEQVVVDGQYRLQAGSRVAVGDRSTADPAGTAARDAGAQGVAAAAGVRGDAPARDDAATRSDGRHRGDRRDAGNRGDRP